jgi:hypothetical protein
MTSNEPNAISGKEAPKDLTKDWPRVPLYSQGNVSRPLKGRPQPSSPNGLIIIIVIYSQAGGIHSQGRRIHSQEREI